MSDSPTNDISANARTNQRTPSTEGRRVLSAKKQLLLADPAHSAGPADVKAGEPVVPKKSVVGDEPRVERRRQIDPTTCERDYSADEIEFMKAMDDYKRKSGRQFPTWSEVLEVVRSLGYHRDR